MASLWVLTALLLPALLLPTAHAAYGCLDGSEPVVKLSDGTIACVSPDTARVLADRGWGEPPKSTELSGIVRAGQLAPLTGDLAGGGEAMTAATALATKDFNAYLKEMGHDWSLELVTRDTATDPQTALRATMSLQAEGITSILGPLSSASAEAVLGYADPRGMLSISCCSTAPELAVADDGLYRVTPDDSSEGAALASLLDHHGVDLAVLAWRGDAWGDGLEQAWRGAYGANAGEGVRYDPDSVDPAAVAAALASEVDSADGQTAVLVFGFSEMAEIMRESINFPELAEARWYGAGVVNSAPEFSEPDLNSFLTSVQFTTPGAKAVPNELRSDIQETLSDQLGQVAGRTFVHASYDSVWLLGMSMLAAGSYDGIDVREKVLATAEGRQGAIGNMTLNAAGDLLNADYEFWQTAPDGPLLAGSYESGQLVPPPQ